MSERHTKAGNQKCFARVAKFAKLAFNHSRHAEQLLSSCLCSIVSICDYDMSHYACHISNAYVDPWDMLNNFCFHVYAQNSVFMPTPGEI